MEVIFLIFLFIIATVAQAVMEMINEIPSLLLNGVEAFPWPIAFVAAHIIEEWLTGFAQFFNCDVLKSGRDDFPVSRREALLKDQIGLFVGLATLITIGSTYPWALWAAIGFILADSIQHVTYSVRFSGYTPGVLTVTFYVGYVIHTWHNAESVNFMAMGIGAVALLGNVIFVALRTRK